MRAIEYVHAGYGHYFVTASTEETQALDSGAIPGWTRTRRFFDVVFRSAPQVQMTYAILERQLVCSEEFPFSTRRRRQECAAVRQNPDWQFEGKVFAVGAPLYGFACGEGLIPLYRLYNDGKGGAPNHRYTASSYVRSVC